MSYDFKEGQSAVEYGESLLSSRGQTNKKQKKRTKQIKRVNQVLGVLQLGDMFLSKKANKKIELLNEKKTFDLQRRKSDFADKTQFENIYDIIKQDGFDPLVEESYTNYFRDKASQDYPNANTDNDKNINSEDWINAATNNFTTKWKKDLKTWRPWLRATEKEFSEPVKQFYAEAVRDAQSPQNTSLLRKTLDKLGLWKDKKIQAAYKLGNLEGNVSPYALQRYTKATNNTDERLRILREGETEQGDYEELPDLIKRIYLSKKVTPELYQQLGDLALIDKGNLYLKNIPLDPTTWEGDEEKKKQLTALLNPNGANIFVTSFKDKALKSKADGGLGWNEAKFIDWLETTGGKDGWGQLLYHRNTGPASLDPSDLREFLPEVLGGKWVSDGPNAMFLTIWGRRAQNLFDVDKQQKGLSLTEGANPADWTSYIEKAFTETIRNNLTLREDGRLEIVEEEVLAYNYKKDLKLPGNETEDETGTPIINTLNKEDKTIYNNIVNFTINTDEGELTGPRAIIYDALYNKLGTEEVPNLNDVKRKMNTLKNTFPDDAESMNNIYIDYLENKSLGNITPPPDSSESGSKEWEDMSWKEKADIDPERLGQEGGVRAWEKGTFWADIQKKQDINRLEKYVETGKQSQFLKQTLKRYGLPTDSSPDNVLAFLQQGQNNLIAKR